MDATLEQVIKSGKVNPLCFGQQITALAAATAMYERGLGSAVVLDGASVVGIITERDFLHRVVAQDRDPRTTRLGDIMTSPVVMVPDSTRAEEALRLMAAGGFRRLPVEKSGTLCGLVALSHLSAWIYELMTPSLAKVTADPKIVSIWREGQK